VAGRIEKLREDSGLKVSLVGWKPWRHHRT